MSSPCVKLLDHSVEDPPGTVYTIDAAHPAPSPGFVSSVMGLDGNFLAALNKTPRADLTAMLKRPGKPDVTSFTQLTLDPYKFSVALADLTGDENDPTSKVFHPQYTALRDKDSVYPASLMKTAPIFAAFQLRFDALQKATQASAADQATPAKLKKFVFAGLKSDWKAKGLGTLPDLGTILDADASGIIFTKTFDRQMNNITHPDPAKNQVAQMNGGMAYLMKHIHAPYLGSALIQSGLCDKDKGGIWTWDAWGEKWPCKGSGTRLYSGQQPTEVQAWAAATYLTLLKQRRLVSPAMSDQMQDVLLNGDLDWAADGLKTTLGAAEVAVLKLWGKHGAFAGSASEALLIERTTSANKKIRYVVVCLLTSTAPVSQYPVALAEPDPDFRTVYDLMLKVLTELLIPALDGVIVANNP
jgi:hypothetical protein